MIRASFAVKLLTALMVFTAPMAACGGDDDDDKNTDADNKKGNGGSDTDKNGSGGSGGGPTPTNGRNPGEACDEAADCKPLECSCQDGVTIDARGCVNRVCGTRDDVCSPDNPSLADLCADHGGVVGGPPSGGGAPGDACEDADGCEEIACVCRDGARGGSQFCVNKVCAAPDVVCSDDNPAMADACADRGGVGGVAD